MKKFFVKIAQVVTKSNKDVDILTCVLGSCIGIILYDPKQKIASLAHVMLPSIENATKRGSAKPNKYVDSAIDSQLKKLQKLRVDPRNLVAKIVGGASMFSSQKNKLFNIGERNVEMASNILNEKGIKIVGRDLGNTYGRSIELFLDSGIIKVYKAGGKLIKVL